MRAVHLAIGSLYENSSGPVLRAVTASLPAVTPANVLDLLDATQQSKRYAQKVSSSNTSTGSAGHGFGFRTRFKEMSDLELNKLLSRKGPPEEAKKGAVKVSKPVPMHRLGQFAAQWTTVGTITKPYTAQSINKTDMFAVVEAGHGQFKGKLCDFHALTYHQ